MYEVYFSNILFPVAPSKIQTKIKNQNKTMNLIDGSEINLLKEAGLSEISFDLLLPNVQYPFAIYKPSFRNAKYYLDVLEFLKKTKSPFYFKVIRTFPNGKVLYDTETRVSLEDYTIKEDAKQGFDVVVSVKLKQYRDYGTKIYDGTSIVTPRSTENAPKATTYTVKEGDTLWNIAKYFYGNGSGYMTIYNANKGVIGNNPNLISPGMVLTIPDATQQGSGSPSGASPYSADGSITDSKKPPVAQYLVKIGFTGAIAYVGTFDISYTQAGKRILQTNLTAPITVKADFGTEYKITIHSIKGGGFAFQPNQTSNRVKWEESTDHIYNPSALSGTGVWVATRKTTVNTNSPSATINWITQAIFQQNRGKGWQNQIKVDGWNTGGK